MAACSSSCSVSISSSGDNECTTTKETQETETAKTHLLRIRDCGEDGPQGRDGGPIPQSSFVEGPTSDVGAVMEEMLSVGRVDRGGRGGRVRQHVAVRLVAVARRGRGRRMRSGGGPEGGVAEFVVHGGEDQEGGSDSLLEVLLALDGELLCGSGGVAGGGG
ncbi:SEC14 cytosolic factor family protein /phosphoglyceride transfer family protein [Striga asiatica]|uniref:SEC14 cytosolic factor family protein /phosphoglyceride transfer family protein n=1 Tax=Striga asiatica TaxID=4170 RepID=A0A5A7PJJ5_STRAF|nr:SEC14 cytosolic factor family protein /phosphoglyceride transfer family protein [Striga asiatica]